MPKTHSSIPAVTFQNRRRKTFEFDILTNRELLIDSQASGHNLFRPHRVSFYAILFILEGEGQHFIDFKPYTYQRGSVIFISKEQVHSFERNEERKAWFMLFTKKFLEQSSLGSSLMQQISLYNYQLYHPILQLTEAEFPQFQELVLQIQEEFDAPDDFATEEIIQSSLKIFLCLAERKRNKNLQTQPQSIYQKDFLQFQELLKEHLLNNRKVQFYANEMAISTKKLNRITYAIKQQAAKTYINDSLVMEMKRFLLNTALSIKEIAYRCGFEESTNFVKYFKKHAGIKPGDFRKKHLNSVN